MNSKDYFIGGNNFMKKDFISWTGSVFGTICTAIQSDQIFQYISLGLTILSTLVAIAYTIWKWYKKANEDGKITSDEIKELGDDLTDVLDDKKKGDKHD